MIMKQIKYNYSERTDKIQYIVIHDTGNTKKGAGAENHFKYFNGGHRGSSADIFVDDKQILIVNDYVNNYTWHCGDGKGINGITNNNSVGIELCVNSDSDYNIAFKNLLNITKQLMKELDIPINRVVRHYDTSGKNCPASMSKDNWFKWWEFKERLQEGSKMDFKYYNTIEEIPESYKTTVRKMVQLGVVKGDGTGLKLSDDMCRMLVYIDRLIGGIK